MRSRVFYSAMSGRPLSTILHLATQNIRQRYFATYVNDSWKISPKLTLNLGLRWDLSTPTKERDNNWSFINPYLANPSAGNRLGSLVFAGDVAASSNPAAAFRKPYPESIYYKAFAPRVGFAYAFSQKTVVRGGYGIFYQPLSYPGWNSGVSGGRDGFNTSILLSSTDGGITPATLFTQGFTGAQYQKPPFFDLGFDNGKYPGPTASSTTDIFPIASNGILRSNTSSPKISTLLRRMWLTRERT